MSWFLPFSKLHILLVSARPLYFVLGFFFCYILSIVAMLKIELH